MGHGTCGEVTHTCNCNTWYIGEACEYSACPNDCGNDGNGACDQTAMVSFVGVCRGVCGRGHGTCGEVTHTCNCNTWYIGEACEYSACPNDCGNDGNGACDQTAMPKSKCKCLSGFVGESCNLATQSNTGWGSTVLVSSGIQATDFTFTPRTGHGAVYHDGTDRLYVFGGFSLNDVFDDLVAFDFAENQWSAVVLHGDEPTGRYGHTMVLYSNEEIIVFGGVLGNDTLTNELWSYDIFNARWTLLPPGSGSVPPGLADHSAAIVNYSHLFVFGGRSDTEDFASVLYKYDLTLRSGWEEIVPLGGPENSIAVRGHSSVYHHDSNSFIVFGGFKPTSAKLSERSQYMHAFHVEKRYWTKWYSSSNPPRERAFHTANIIGNYMVVYGGNVHIHQTSANIKQPLQHEKCYEDGVELYHLGCHQWVDFDTLAKDFQDNSAASYPHTISRGRFGHASAVRDDTTLLIVGGYNGVTLKDTIAIKMPGTVAVNPTLNDNTSKCGIHASETSCRQNPDCGWCTNPSGCLAYDQQNSCDGTFELGVCNGTCSTLSTCESCAIWGQGPAAVVTAPQWSRKNELCGWCVQQQRCYPVSAPEGFCADRSSYTGAIGWWGRNGTFISEFQSCVTLDKPPGMTWIKYRHPKNESHPDEVTIVEDTVQQFVFDGLQLEHKTGGYYTAEYRGFIQPLQATPREGSELRVWMGSSKVTSSLHISTDENPENLEQVAAYDSTEFKQTEAVRADESPIFQNLLGTYYVSQEERLAISEARSLIPAAMELRWNGNVPEGGVDQGFSAEYLMPYTTTSCNQYVSCMGCLVDSACGWCPISRTCETRDGPMLSVERCGSGAGLVEHYLVTDVGNCGACDVHVDCLSCAEDPYCEWVLNDTTCVRRGRFTGAVTDTAQCHGQCSQYTSCESCSKHKQVQECAWCEGLQTCFMFGTYITTYNYGQCSHWFDLNKSCPDCSRHTTCGACLNDFQCGWCGNTDNPTIGICHSGDFQGPAVNITCSALVGVQYNRSLSDPADWSYRSCPDVEECRLELDDCHANATCINTPESYQCECKQGFVGNGKTVCNKTCFHECVHGHCSGPPNYECICDIGWTGVNCSTDCGCNYHSTCVNGIGQCDDCQHWTMGEHCELCQPGSYGNATNSPGCQECQCNGHGDASMGRCDNITGICYCMENTQGDYCDACMEGFYGDPRNNEHCYRECEGRMILSDVTSSALGSHNGTGVEDPEKVYCLWILTVYNNLTDPLPVDPIPSISFTVNTIHTACGRDYVYVYDGLPDDMLVDAPSFITEGRSLGSFCGQAQLETPTVVATSGILTVVFQANVSDPYVTTGFTAVYQVNSCPDSCLGNRQCDVSNGCVCKAGYRGEDCETQICPDDCGTGTCDQELGLCDCPFGHIGPSCQYPYIEPLLQGVWTTLYDPSLHTTTGNTPSELVTAPLERMGHSMVVAELDSKLWMFGGYSQDQGPLNDIWSYDLRIGQWQQITPIGNLIPKARHFHAAAFVEPSSMFLVGGLTDTGVEDDFWEFNVTRKNWTQITGFKNFPHVAGHTLTVVSNQRLVLIGGYSPEDGLLHAVVEYNIITGLWEAIPTTGTPPTGLYGHTTVWHQESGSLFVYGGYRFHLDSIRISDKLYSLNYAAKEWSMIPPEAYYKPEPRMFHTAVATSQYMVVVGGGTPTYNFTNTVLAYRFDCNKWLNMTNEELVVGAIPSPASSQAAVAMDDTVYLYGGTNGQVLGDLRKLTLPEDLCSTRTTTTDCRSLLGCGACVVANDTSKLVFCRSNADANLSSYCTAGNTLMNGNVCDAKRVVEDRPCGQHTLCSECVMTHPSHPGATQTCKWCSNCPEGKCIAGDADCQTEHDCQMDSQREIVSAGQCAELACEASDCEKCTASEDCIWTKQFMRTSETRRMLNSKPVYDWNCFNQALLRVAPANYDIQRVPPDLCPIPCHQYTSCGDCLDSVGADGGWQECMWSASLRKCMSPTYMPLACASGECGPLYNGTSTACPTPCYLNIQCAHCLKQPGCGWCGVNNNNGTGVCMEGGLHGPLDGLCTAQNVSLKYQSMPAAINSHIASLLTASKPGTEPDWTFVSCPPENECLNGHHDCMENEDCHNTPESYECRCKPGYERQDVVTGVCKPVCTPACIHGECTEPTVCQCLFGYVGADCSVACQCNGHSECANISTTDVCLQCRNNTIGTNCEFCLPLFVGNATNGGTCKACSEICHSNTEICLSEVDFNYSVAANYDLMTDNVAQYFPRGPVHDASTVCVKCGNFSAGRTCDTCIDGYFKDERGNGECKRCQCNGHWDTCDKETGLKCQCQNNTATPTCPSTGTSDTNKYTEPCWEHQCSTCKELFAGTPTEGRQCYRQMHVEQDNCFEPITQNNCPLDAGATLPQGRSSFFYVQPKYTNLDIRLTVDVTVGALDVFLTYDESVFRVFVNQTSGVHTIDYNPDLQYLDVERREKRDIFGQSDFRNDRQRRSSQLVDPDAQELNTGTTEEPVVLQVVETLAKGINTFVTVENGHFISVVKSLRNRLVVSLPHQFHQLKTKKFYIALLSHGTEWSNATQGIMYFRQDQPQIDLFVFFSVFLSCFFLFLAVLVVAWKIKVGFEARNDRRMRALEMEHRASRPFGKVMVYIDNHQPNPGQTHKRHSNRLTSRLGRSGSSLSGSAEHTQNSAAHKDPFHVGIIAAEPTDDGIANIGTLVISLPGHTGSPVKACLGSALVTLKHSNKQQPTEVHVRQPRYQGVKPMSASCRRSSNRRV
ncbi:multiple epidermal growth factor-like domains protein 8 [Amphiura filiformis]|uniref:multiple epidermal growth factor-like domains protein 8 n=1 Tax=Amphiura filiformis TaxID=82378 RepID=UPI003B227C0E